MIFLLTFIAISPGFEREQFTFQPAISLKRKNLCAVHPPSERSFLLV
jgi:hypothetical protein